MKQFHAARHTEARGVVIPAICACEPTCMCRDASTPDMLKGKWTWRCLLAWLESMQQVMRTPMCRHACDRKHAGRHTGDQVAHSYWPATFIYTQLPWFIFTHSDTPRTLQNVA